MPVLAPAADSTSPSRKTRCAAIDRWGEKCARQKEEGDPRWCDVHRKEQTRLYKDYKRCTSELQSFEMVEAGRDRRVIEQCEDVETLKRWYNNLRHKFVLLTRAIEARSYHHEHFYAEDVDFGHSKFIQNLKRDKKLCEIRLHEMEHRAHELILLSANASFVLEETKMPEASEDFQCANHTDHPSKSPSKRLKKSSPRLKPKPLPTEDEVDNPLEAAYQQRRNEALKSVIDYFHRCCGYADPVLAYERKLICEAVIREIIIHDPALAFAAQSYHSIQGFISECNELSVQDLERLQKLLLIKRCCEPTTAGRRENYLRNAIQNTLFRNPDNVPEEERVWFLGGWVYKSLPAEDMPIRGWDHLYAFIYCGHCVTSCTRSLAELVRNRKFEVSPTAEPRYADWADGNDPSSNSRVLRALGILVGESSSCIQRNVFRNWSLQTGEVWTERQDRAWLFVRVHLDEPWLNTFIALLAEKWAFDVITQNGRTKLVASLHPQLSSDTAPRVWVSRERTATSETALKDAEWKDLVQLDDNSFDTAKSPEQAWGYNFVEDAMDIFIMDMSENVDQNVSTFSDFMWTVAYAGLEAQGYDPERWNDIFDDVGITAADVWEDHRASVDVSMLDLSWKCKAGSASCRDKGCENCRDRWARFGARNMFAGCGHCNRGDNLHDWYLESHEHATESE